jgi:hypothetical protein
VGLLRLFHFLRGSSFQPNSKKGIKVKMKSKKNDEECSLMAIIEVAMGDHRLKLLACERRPERSSLNFDHVKLFYNFNMWNVMIINKKPDHRLEITTRFRSPTRVCSRGEISILCFSFNNLKFSDLITKKTRLGEWKTSQNRLSVWIVSIEGFRV